MTLPQHVLYGIGGTVSTDRATRPTNAQLKIIGYDGTALLGPVNATVSTINTTLAQAATKGTRAINVASNAGINIGAKCWLQDDPEDLPVRLVSGVTITFRRPLMYDHVNGAVVEGTQIHYTMSGAQANTLAWDARCEWNIDGGAALKYTSLVVTKYPLVRDAQATDMADIEPAIYDLVPDEVELTRLLDLAHERVLSRIAMADPNFRVHVFTGSTEFRHATALAAWMLFYMRQRGSEAKELYERFTREMEAEILRVCQIVPRDTDQDGTVEADERLSPRCGRIRRA